MSDDYEPRSNTGAAMALAYLRRIAPKKVRGCHLNYAAGIRSSSGVAAMMARCLEAGLVCREGAKVGGVRWWVPFDASRPVNDDQGAADDDDGDIDMGKRLERGYGSDVPLRDLAQVWGGR